MATQTMSVEQALRLVAEGEEKSNQLAEARTIAAAHENEQLRVRSYESQKKHLVADIAAAERCRVAFESASDALSGLTDVDLHRFGADATRERPGSSSLKDVLSASIGAASRRLARRQDDLTELDSRFAAGKAI